MIRSIWMLGLISLMLRCTASDSVTVSLGSLNPVFDTEKTSYNVECNGGTINWKYEGKKTVLISIPDFGIYNYLCEPGDDVKIVKGNPVIVTGKGADKYIVQNRWDKIRSQIKPAAFPALHKTVSWNDYYVWMEALDIHIDSGLALLSEFKKVITPFSFRFLMSKNIAEIESNRLLKYVSFRKSGISKKDSFSMDRYCKAFDSLYNSKYVKWLRSGDRLSSNAQAHYLLDLSKRYILNTYRNDYALDEISTSEKRKKKYFDFIRQTFRKKVLDELLVQFVCVDIIKELKFSETAEDLLDEYYRDSRCKSCKDVVKKYEAKRRVLAVHKPAPEFRVIDENNDTFNLGHYKNKVVVLSFFRYPYEKKLRIIEQKIRSVDFGSKIHFVNVVDKEKMPGCSIAYAANETTVFVNEIARDRIRKKYKFQDFQGSVLIGPDFNVCSLDLLADSADKNLMKQQFEDCFFKQFDGTYVFYDDKGKRNISAVFGDSILKDVDIPFFYNGAIAEKRKIFIQIKDSFDIAEENIDSERKFVLSDIEGNFNCLANLLINNQVIDKDMNWIFGDGQLIFAGDMFDRGNQVTECLWLLYSLEEKARTEGGRVYFILGNHEIMNLQGDHRYVTDKYKNTARLLDKPIAELYCKDSELGRWLRTKNIVEKIGDLLFVHGGISAQVNQSGMSATDINRMAKPYYDCKKDDYGNDRINLVMSTSVGPFWYRGYYDKQALEPLIDSILKQYGVSHIITGHTVIADTISTHYNHKVINTDTRHASGKSEALLIEGARFYRVNDKGQRWLLFDDADKRKLN